MGVLGAGVQSPTATQSRLLHPDSLQTSRPTAGSRAKGDLRPGGTLQAHGTSASRTLFCGRVLGPGGATPVLSAAAWRHVDPSGLVDVQASLLAGAPGQEPSSTLPQAPVASPCLLPS